MSEFKGTKGWKITDLGEEADDIRIQLNYGSIDVWYGLEGWPTKEQAQANALLISKAPELLDMLSGIAPILERYGEIAAHKEVLNLIKESTTP